MLRQLNKLESIAIAEKGRNDFVSRVDEAAEEKAATGSPARRGSLFEGCGAVCGAQERY